MNTQANFLPLCTLAARLGLPEPWLKAEADLGNIPCIRAGRRRLFDPDDVRRVLRERALNQCVDPPAGIESPGSRQASSL